MIIGVPKEIKNNENRVGMTPGTVISFRNAGHEVLVQSGAGLGIGFTDEDYEAAGAKVVATAAEAWKAEMVVKVKEPLQEEYDYFQEEMILYTYLHLAPEPELTKALVDRKVSAVAYETIQLADGSLPLLTPMSEVAGRMSIQIGAHFLEKAHGGKGVLLSGVPGLLRARSPSSGAASSAPMRHELRWDSVRTSAFLILIPSGFVSWMISFKGGSKRSCPIRITLRKRLRPPISSWVRC